MILVAGGTGILGTLVVRELLARGERVRVLTRDLARASSLPAEVERVTGDVRVEADRARAVAGCRTVVSAIHGFAGPGAPSPETIDRDANIGLIHAASTARVEHFVLLSVQGAAADHPMTLHRAKHAAEHALRASGLPFTIIRPTAFLETWLRVIGAGKSDGSARPLVFGPGRAPINFVSTRDVAALVARAVTEPALRGQTIEIGGPQNLSMTDLAERLIAAGRNRAPIKRIPLPMLRVMSVVARPFSPVFARQAAAAVVMNTRDMTFSAADPVATTTLDDVLAPASPAT
jgi:NADH dehydrogenase